MWFCLLHLMYAQIKRVTWYLKVKKCQKNKYSSTWKILLKYSNKVFPCSVILMLARSPSV